MTLKEVVAKLPASQGSNYGGAWVGWFLRMAMAPIIGYENARDIVVRALGPGFDYEAPNATLRGSTK